MGGAAGRADRQLGPLRFLLRGLQHRPLGGEDVGQRQAPVDVGLGVVGDQDHRVLGEEGVDPARLLDQRGEAFVGLGDRLDRGLGPVAVRVVVVVGQREEEEVEAVLLHQLDRAAGGVGIADAGDRGRLAGDLLAGVEVAVEELLRAPGVVAELQPGRVDRHPQQPVERDFVAVAAAVDQVRRAGGPRPGVVELLEERLDLGRGGRGSCCRRGRRAPGRRRRRASPRARSRTRRSAARAGGTSSCR